MTGKGMKRTKRLRRKKPSSQVPAPMNKVVRATAATMVASTALSLPGATLAAMTPTMPARAATGTLWAMAITERVELPKGISKATTALVNSAMPAPIEANDGGRAENRRVPKPIDWTIARRPHTTPTAMLWATR